MTNYAAAVERLKKLAGEYERMAAKYADFPSAEAILSGWRDEAAAIRTVLAALSQPPATEAQREEIERAYDAGCAKAWEVQRSCHYGFDAPHQQSFRRHIINAILAALPPAGDS